MVGAFGVEGTVVIGCFAVPNGLAMPLWISAYKVGDDLKRVDRIRRRIGPRGLPLR